MTIFKLDYPVTIGDETITEVTANRLKVKDQQKAQAFSSDLTKFQATLITASTGLTPVELAEFDAADYNALWETVESFLFRPVPDSK